jgi:shikimate kinase
MSLALIGFQNCGKTSLAKAYSVAFGLDFVDTDDLLIEASGYLSSRKAHTAMGGDAFRALESQCVLSLSNQADQIIATGGGVVLKPDNIAHLKTLGPVVYLQLARETVRARMTLLPSFLEDASEFDAYFDAREPIYQSAADLILPAEGASIAELTLSLHQSLFQAAR